MEIPEIVRITPQRFEDARGFFLETYKRSDFEAFGLTYAFVQHNLSHSSRGVLRGMHYQNPPMAQAKLLAVLSGTIFDVAVDIRQGSPTYGRWIGVTLSASDPTMLLVPPGFAHGFCVLSEEADLSYKVTSEYAPDLERGFLWNDPDIGIEWPVSAPILSDKDAQLPPLCHADNGFGTGWKAG
jgi:dTDP-4-dehydrorhamnose 3,5-epimerase